MRYLATQVRIFTETNSRGEYHYMSMRLFNDKNPKANPARLPVYYITQPDIINAFLAHPEALTKNDQGWQDVDMSKLPDEGMTSHHLDDMAKETVALDGWYQATYRRDYTDAQGTFHAKGTVRLGANNKPLPPVNSLTVMVQYFEDEAFEDGRKVTRWMPVETKEQVARGVLERSYVKLESTTVDNAMSEVTDVEDDAEEDKEAKRKALEEQLAALK